MATSFKIPLWLTTAGIALIVFGAFVLLVWIWLPEPEPIQPPSQPLPQIVAPTIEVPDTSTPNKPAMRAVEKTPQVKRRTNLPPAIFDQPETYILSTAKLEAEERDYTLTSVLDRRTGETEVYASPDAYPWFSLADKTTVTAYYGLKNGTPTFRGVLSKEVFRLKDVRAQGVVTLDSDGEYFAGIGLQYKW